MRLKTISLLAVEISWWDCGERRNGLRKSWLRNGCRMTEDRQRTDKELWNKGSKCIFQTSPCILIITYGRGGGVGRGGVITSCWDAMSPWKGWNTIIRRSSRRGFKMWCAYSNYSCKLSDVKTSGNHLNSSI